MTECIPLRMWQAALWCNCVPLQGQACQKWEQWVVGENWNALFNQWERFASSNRKMRIEDVEGYTKNGREELAEASGILVGSERDHRSRRFADLIC